LRNIKKEPVEQQEIKPDLKPFVGGLAALRIQPDVKSELKFSPLIKSHIKIEPITHDECEQQPPDIKPKLEHFKSTSLASLQIRPILQPDVKLRWRLKNFTCDMCKKCIGTRGGLLYHIKAHINGRPFKCNICQRSYATKNDFNTHEKRHSGIQYTCHICSKKFSVKQYLADHITGCHFPRLLKCTFCDRYFSTAQTLNQHFHNSHPHSVFSKPTYTCHFCGLVVVTKAGITSHLSSAVKMRFQCKICLKRFPCRSLSAKHTREKQSKLMRCKICKIMIANIDGHMANRHRKIPCQFCPYVAQNQNLSRAHLRECKSSTKERRKAAGLYCAACDLSFTSNFHFTRHRNILHGQFQCQKCKATFFSKKSVTMHHRRHRKQSKYIVSLKN
jgi:C2H2-type zinc finger/Zinc finger, C2H2 type